MDGCKGMLGDGPVGVECPTGPGRRMGVPAVGLRVALAQRSRGRRDDLRRSTVRRNLTTAGKACRLVGGITEDFLTCDRSFEPGAVASAAA